MHDGIDGECGAREPTVCGAHTSEPWSLALAFRAERGADLGQLLVVQRVQLLALP
jgi:hypothetical protein